MAFRTSLGSCARSPRYGFFRVVLERTDPRSVGRGGTPHRRWAAAALEAFGPAGGPPHPLITDGEDQTPTPSLRPKDPQGRRPRRRHPASAMSTAADHTLTDPKTGGHCFLVDREDKVVRSRLDGKTLRGSRWRPGRVHPSRGCGAESGVDHQGTHPARSCGSRKMSRCVRYRATALSVAYLAVAVVVAGRRGAGRRNTTSAAFGSGGERGEL